MTSPQQLTAVVCGFHRQFVVWCHANDLDPRDPSLCFVQREEQIRGRIFDKVIAVGDYPQSLLRAAQTRLRSALHPSFAQASGE